MYSHTYTYTHTHTHTHTHYIHMHRKWHKCITLMGATLHIYIHIYIHTYKHTHIHTHVYSYTRIHKYTYTHAHTYTGLAQTYRTHGRHFPLPPHHMYTHPPPPRCDHTPPLPAAPRAATRGVCGVRAKSTSRASSLLAPVTHTLTSFGGGAAKMAGGKKSQKSAL